MATNFRNMTVRVALLACSYYLICLWSCKDQPEAQNTISQEAPKELPSDFIEFYKAFHADSLFQVNHIIFPISSTIQDTAGRDSTITWEPETWKMHHAIIPDKFWTVDFTIPFDGAVVEYVYTKAGGYWMERRYVRQDSTWFLIYYSGLHSAGVAHDTIPADED